MKKTIMETSVYGKRGIQRVNTYGYNTKIDGLNVIRVVGSEEEFCIIHAKSGASMGIYFKAYTRAVRFANKYLADFDFNRSMKELQSDNGLCGCIMDAIYRMDKQDGISY